MRTRNNVQQYEHKRSWKQALIFVQIALAFDAFAWNPFKPNNLEDCILDGVKNAKTDQAANAVIFACRQKFPTTTPAAPTTPAIPYEEPLIHTFSALGMSRPTLNALISNLNIINSEVVQTGTNTYGVKSYDYGHHLSIELTNRNDFAVYSIEIGVLPKNGKCSWEDRSYTEIHQCPGQAGPRSTGIFKCNIPRIATRRINYCTTGFGIYGREADVNQFKIKYSIPNRK